MMPEMDGFRSSPPCSRTADWRDIPVIVITARDLDAKDRERLNSGVRSVLVKESFQPAELSSASAGSLPTTARRSAAISSVVTKLLYVEDNDDNVYMLKMRLELLDEFEVLVAEDGEKGCAVARRAEAGPDPDGSRPAGGRRLGSDAAAEKRPAHPRHPDHRAVGACARRRAREGASRQAATSSTPSRSSSIGCWGRSGSSWGGRARPLEMESAQAANSQVAIRSLRRPAPASTAARLGRAASRP